MKRIARRIIVTAIIAVVWQAARADQEGRNAFENELRILPAFTAEMSYKAGNDEASMHETARIVVLPKSGQIRIGYETLPLEIVIDRGTWHGRTTERGLKEVAQERRVRAARVGAALGFLLNPGMTEEMDTRMENRGEYVEYRVSRRPGAEGEIIWIAYRFDHRGPRSMTIGNRSGGSQEVKFEGRERLVAILGRRKSA